MKSFVIMVPFMVHDNVASCAKRRYYWREASKSDGLLFVQGAQIPCMDSQLSWCMLYHFKVIVNRKSLCYMQYNAYRRTLIKHLFPCIS